MDNNFCATAKKTVLWETSVAVQGTPSALWTQLSVWTTTLCYSEEFKYSGAHPLHYREQLLQYGQQLLHHGQQFLHYGEEFWYSGQHPLYCMDHFLYYGQQFLYYG